VGCVARERLGHRKITESTGEEGFGGFELKNGGRLRFGQKGRKGSLVGLRSDVLEVHY
jgi:hypothetical protein